MSYASPQTSFDATASPASTPEKGDSAELAAPQGTPSFLKEGAIWTITYAGQVIRLKRSTGLSYIEYVLRYPGSEFHSLELLGGSELSAARNLSANDDSAQAQPDGQLDTIGFRRGGTGDAGEMLDAVAKAAYRRRLGELREALENATELGNSERAEGIKDEIEALARELSRAVRLGGRDRRAASAGERARLSVTRAIKAAIERIAEQNAPLGLFLSRSIRTGTFCSYIPDSRQPKNRPRRDQITEDKAGRGSIDAVAAAVVAELSEIAAHAAPDGTVTILFSDLENSSALFDKLGDLRAQRILDAHNAIIRETVALHKGFEVKSMGDGFMIAFSSARRALLCAIAIQRAFAVYREQHSEQPIHVRIGLHVGETINESDDFFGKAVILAARIAGLARGGEILVSSTLCSLTESAGDLRFADAGEVQLKGLSGTYRLFRAIWQ